MEFILASSSPRRKELLRLLGLQPRILIPEADERRLEGEGVLEFLKRVTGDKGRAVYRDEYFHTPIISSDTIVLLENSIIGKPVDPGDARGILQRLSGRVHEVLTGVCIRYRGEEHYDYARTAVHFTHISEGELEYYLEHEHYMDKAGAYAIQGMASVFVEKIDGCYFNVMGFPLNLFYSMLKGMGITLFAPVPAEQ